MSEEIYRILVKLANVEILTEQELKTLYDAGITVKVTTETKDYAYELTEYGKHLFMIACEKVEK